MLQIDTTSVSESLCKNPEHGFVQFMIMLPTLVTLVIGVGITAVYFFTLVAKKQLTEKSFWDCSNVFFGSFSLVSGISLVINAGNIIIHLANASMMAVFVFYGGFVVIAYASRGIYKKFKEIDPILIPEDLK